MKNTFLLLLVALVGLSCSDNKPQSESEQVAEVLDSKPMKAQIEDYASRSSKYGTRTNAVETLFDEAMENDENLEILVQSLSEINTEAIENYSNYKNNNERYWSAVTSNLAGLQDTVLREEVSQFFGKLEQKYKQSIYKNESTIGSIQQKQVELADQFILLKIAVTQPMMQSYQKTELIELRKLQQIAKTYDSLIHILEQKTKSIKWKRNIIYP